ncbi:MAG: hypothetical protein LRY67_06540 [Gammaproteobacteria bacterium]|nr:hypothetical protein [Gammaproteobacteria bacterium]MCD8525367.1 hypothetical protein [Gammaproteobacteria bacterium]MCD8542828.1 hypothetical protein [Gammaproteobacteria bacterium]MCD8573712.1 hypothetical protein [Gammaproteobacteria bacterium]
MSDTQATVNTTTYPSYIDSLYAKIDTLIANYWLNNPDLRELVDKKRQQEALVTRVAEALEERLKEVIKEEPVIPLRGAALRARMLIGVE